MLLMSSVCSIGHDLPHVFSKMYAHVQARLNSNGLASAEKEAVEQMVSRLAKLCCCSKMDARWLGGFSYKDG